MQKMLYLSLLISQGLYSADLQIRRPAIFAPSSLGDVELSHDDGQFYVLRNMQRHAVENHLVDRKLRNVTPAQLRAFLNHGHIEVSKMDDVDEFVLRARAHGLGGGPVTAWILYSATKTLCYGGAAAAAGTAVVATGGAAAVALGGSTAATMSAGAASAGIGYLASGSALGAAMSTGGATIVAGAIASSAAATGTATLLTAGTLAATGGCVATAMAAVETASLGAAAIGMWLPLP